MKLIAKALTLGAALFMVGCASQNTTEISRDSMQIVRGMSYQEVLRLASDYPMQRTFKGRGTALQYCSTDSWNGIGSYVVVWMVDDTVEGLTQYDRGTGFQSCQQLFREVDWGQAPADVKIKLDID